MKSSYAYVRGVQLPYGAGPNDPAQVFGPIDFVPAELVTFFAPATIVGISQYRFTSTRYLWQVEWLDPNTGPNDPNVAFGAAYDGTIIVIWNVSAKNGILVYGPGFGGPVPAVDFSGTLNLSGLVNFDNAWEMLTGVVGTIDAGAKLTTHGFTEINPLGSGAIVNGGNNDFQIDGQTHPRGLLARISNQGTSLYTTSSTAVTDTGFTATPKVKAGRAAQLTFRGFITSTVTQLVAFRVRYKTLTGSDVAFLGTVVTNALAGNAVPFHLTCFVANNTANDIANNFVIGGNLVTGTTAATLTSVAIGSNEVSADWYDAGRASAYPLAFSMVA